MSRADFLFAVWLASLGVLYYVYHGYLVVLRSLNWAAGHRDKARADAGAPQTPPPSITILLTVHNEEQRIVARIDNFLALDYDRSRMEILIASDGSTDRTNTLVGEQSARAPVRLVACERIGKSAVQNRAIAEACGDIIVFADADCVLARDYLRELMRPFADEQVGCVTGCLSMASGDGAVARGQGYYWNFEIMLREQESALGILAVASGSAMAVRRRAFVPLPADVGEDCTIPLDTVLQSLRVIHAPAAHAVDSMASDPRGEFRARVRMTLRNWNGTWRRAALLNPFRHPGYAFALWSHKLLRWLSPIFIIVMSAASLALFGHPLLWPLPLLTLAFFALAGLGCLEQFTGVHLPIAGTVYSFCLANLGFLVGVAKAIAGRKIVSYGKSANASR